MKLIFQKKSLKNIELLEIMFFSLKFEFSILKGLNGLSLFFFELKHKEEIFQFYANAFDELSSIITT